MESFDNMDKQEIIKITNGFIEENKQLGYEIYTLSNEVNRLNLKYEKELLKIKCFYII